MNILHEETDANNSTVYEMLVRLSNTIETAQIIFQTHKRSWRKGRLTPQASQRTLRHCILTLTGANHDHKDFCAIGSHLIF